MVKMTKASAWLRGREFVVPNDITDQLPYVLNHRILLSSNAVLQGLSKYDVIQDIINNVKRPYMGETK